MNPNPGKADSWWRALPHPIPFSGEEGLRRGGIPPRSDSATQRERLHFSRLEKRSHQSFFFIVSVVFVRSSLVALLSLHFSLPAFFCSSEMNCAFIFYFTPRPTNDQGKKKKLGQATIITAHEADSRTEHCCRKVPAAAMIPPSPRPGRGGFLINSIYLRSPFHHATVLRTTTTLGTSSNARKERPDDQCLAAFSPSRQRVRCRISFSLFMFGEKRESK